jgi:hypothetical protein
MRSIIAKRIVSDSSSERQEVAAISIRMRRIAECFR